MTDAWYDKTASEEDIIYEESVNKIRNGVGQGLSFEQATSLIDVKDEALRATVLDDSLKVLIAEMHLTGKKLTLDALAKRLGLPPKRLKQAKEEMMKDIEAAAIEKYKSDSGMGGNA